MIRARPCAEVVITPACEPVYERASYPRLWIAIASSAIEMRSPAVSSMSSSRPGGSGLTWWARSSSSSVVSPIAETTTTTSSPALRAATIRSATRLMRSASATDEPPYFCTTSATAAHSLPATTLSVPTPPVEVRRRVSDRPRVPGVREAGREPTDPATHSAPDVGAGPDPALPPWSPRGHGATHGRCGGENGTMRRARVTVRLAVAWRARRAAGWSRRRRAVPTTASRPRRRRRLDATAGRRPTRGPAGRAWRPPREDRRLRRRYTARQRRRGRPATRRWSRRPPTAPGGSTCRAARSAARPTSRSPPRRTGVYQCALPSAGARWRRPASARRPGTTRAGPARPPGAAPVHRLAGGAHRPAGRALVGRRRTRRWPGAGAPASRSRPTSASLAPPIDVGHLLLRRRTARRPLPRVALGTLILAGRPAPAPATVALAGPVVTGGRCRTAAAARPTPRQRPDRSVDTGALHHIRRRTTRAKRAYGIIGHGSPTALLAFRWSPGRSTRPPS